MNKKSSDERAAFKVAAEWEAHSRQQLRERAEFKTAAGQESSDQRRRLAERILAEYRIAIENAGRATWDYETRPTKPIWKQFTAAELLAKYPSNRSDKSAR